MFTGDGFSWELLSEQWTKVGDLYSWTGYLKFFWVPLVLALLIYAGTAWFVYSRRMKAQRSTRWQIFEITPKSPSEDFVVNAARVESLLLSLQEYTKAESRLKLTIWSIEQQIRFLIWVDATFNADGLEETIKESLVGVETKRIDGEETAALNSLRDKEYVVLEAFPINDDRSAFTTIRTAPEVEEQGGSDPILPILATILAAQAGEEAGIEIVLGSARKDWGRDGARYVESVYLGDPRDKRMRGGNCVDVALRGIHFALNGAMRLVFGLIEEAFRSGKPIVTSPNSAAATVVITPGQQEEIAQLRKKLSYPNFNARVFMFSAPMNQRRLLERFRSTFAGYNKPAGSRFMLCPHLMQETFRYSLLSPLNDDAIMNTQEISNLWHMPTSSYVKNSPKLKTTSTYQSAGTKVFTERLIDEKEKIPMGYIEAGGKRQPMYLSEKDLRRHLYLLGGSGTGKSTILEHISRYLVNQTDYGFILMDPAEDLFRNVLDMAQRSGRLDDVVIIAPHYVMQAPEEMGFRIVGLNPVDNTGDIGLVEQHKNTARAKRTAQTSEIFEAVHGWGEQATRATKVFSDLIRLFGEVEEFPLTLLEMSHYLNQPCVRERIAELVPNTMEGDRLKLHFTRTFSNLKKDKRDEIASPIVHRMELFLSNPGLMYTLGQGKNSIDFKDIMNKGKIVLCCLSLTELGTEGAQALGRVVTSLVYQAAISRVTERERPFFVILDEFQNFCSLEQAKALSMIRKFNVSYVMAHQYLSQPEGIVNGKQIIDAVFANCANRVIGRISDHDAQYLGSELEAPGLEDAAGLSARDYTNLPDYTFHGRFLVDGAPQDPVTFKILPPHAWSIDEEILKDPDHLNTLDIEEIAKEAKRRSRGIDVRALLNNLPSMHEIGLTYQEAKNDVLKRWRAIGAIDDERTKDILKGIEHGKEQHVANEIKFYKEQKAKEARESKRNRTKHPFEPRDGMKQEVSIDPDGILWHLYCAKYATTYDLMAFFGVVRSTVYVHLQSLRKDGHVGRKGQDGQENDRRSVFYLLEKSVPLIGEAMRRFEPGLTPGTRAIKKRIKAIGDNPGQAYHSHVAGIYAILRTMQDKGQRWSLYIKDFMIEGKYFYVEENEDGGPPVMLCPDAVVELQAIRRNEKTYSRQDLFIEYDRGKETSVYLKQKLTNYIKLYRNHVWERVKVNLTTRPVTLIVAEQEAAMNEIRRVMKDLYDEFGELDLPIFINTMQHFTERPLTGWRKINGKMDEFYDVFGEDVSDTDDAD